MHKNFKAVCEYVAEQIEKFNKVSKDPIEDIGSSKGEKRPLVFNANSFETPYGLQKRTKFNRALIDKEIETYAYIKRGSFIHTFG